MGKPIVRAILDGAQQIAVPAFVSTLCICIVFVPVVFLTGAARYLFTPLALAVVFAMMASYILSRTLVPTMVKYLLRSEVARYRVRRAKARRMAAASSGASTTVSPWLRAAARRLPPASRGRLAHRELVTRGFVLSLTCAALSPFIGTDFFPRWTPARSGSMSAPPPAPASKRPSRSSRTSKYYPQGHSARELTDILDNIGLPNSGYNLAFSDSGTIGSFDGEILVSLKPGESRLQRADYVRELRRRLIANYPDLTFFFQPADIVGQTLILGCPRPLTCRWWVRSPMRRRTTRSRNRSKRGWHGFPAQSMCTCTRS